MVNHLSSLCQLTQQADQQPISRPQLPLLLAKVNGKLFARLLFEWFGLKLEPDQKRWFALDGKDLRGNIQPGHTRGQACVSVLAHESEELIGPAYYSGTKESEKPTVRQLLNDEGLYSQPITLDAIHINPLTINGIEGAGGVYIIGLKANQAQLYRYGICRSLMGVAIYERSDKTIRGHGRVEQRRYACFTISPAALAPRWQAAGLVTLTQVIGKRQGLRGESASEETSYFVSNSEPANQCQADELFDAIRQHWRIEAMHHLRDVTFLEDALRTGKQAVSRLISSLRTLVINLLRRNESRNMSAQLEDFANRFPTLLQFMTQQKVL